LQSKPENKVRLSVSSSCGLPRGDRLPLLILGTYTYGI
jgi:hypothetical protein